MGCKDRKITKIDYCLIIRKNVLLIQIKYKINHPDKKEIDDFNIHCNEYIKNEGNINYNYIRIYISKIRIRKSYDNIYNIKNIYLFDEKTDVNDYNFHINQPDIIKLRNKFINFLRNEGLNDINCKEGDDEIML
jgi:hypothetical protein